MFLLTVVEGGVESAVSLLNSCHGDQLEVKSFPLRTYEGFSKNVLGVEDETLTKPSPHKLGSDGIIYFLHFVVEYQGQRV